MRLLRFGLLFGLLIIVVIGAYVAWCYRYVEATTPQPLADRVAVVPSGAGLDAKNPVQTLVQALATTDVLILGEEYGDVRHAASLVALLKEAERVAPWKVAVLGLEIFDVHQSLIDAYLENGNEDPLLQSPGQEVLRGHLNSPQLVEAILRVLRTVREINNGRTPRTRMKVVAMDRAPARGRFKTWWEDATTLARIKWLMGRDELIAAALTPLAQAAKVQNRAAIVLVGSAHAQRSGAVLVGPPLMKERVKPLAARLSETFKILTVVQNDPTDDCEDVVEAFLRARGETASALYDLRTDPLGDVLAMRCDAGIPPPMPYRFDPDPYQARDHFDFYWYYPPRRA